VLLYQQWACLRPNPSIVFLFVKRENKKDKHKKEDKHTNERDKKENEVKS